MGRRFSLYFLIALVSGAALAACGGGAGGGGAVPPSITATGAPGAFKGVMSNASFSIKMPVYATPKPKAKLRKPKSGLPNCGECSPSLKFTVNGTVAATVNLTSGTQGLYFITIPLPVGTDSIVADLYDGSNATGTKIATGSTGTTIVVNATNNVNLTITSIIAKVCVYNGNYYYADVSNPPVLAGTSGSRTFYLAALDPDNQQIYNPVLPSVTVTATASPGATGSVTVTPPTTAPGASSVSVSWTASTVGTFILDTSLPCGNDETLHAAGPYVYVANQGDGSVQIFDQNKNSVSQNGSTAEGAIGAFYDSVSPSAMVFDSQTSPKKLFVADFATGRVLVYNAETNEYMATIGTSLRPWGLSLSSDGTRLFVSASGTQDQVQVFDTTTLTSTVTAPSSPNSLMADGSFLNGLTTFMDPSLGQDVTVVSARYPQQSPTYYGPSLVTLTSDMPTNYDANVMPSPGPLAAAGYMTAYAVPTSAPRGTLLVRENGGQGVQWINLNTNQVGSVLYTGPNGVVPDQYVPGPNAIAVQTLPSNGSRAFAVGSTNAVMTFFQNAGAWQYSSCLSLGTSACSINGDPYDPVGVVFSSDGTAAYVANYGDNTVSVLDARCSTPSLSYEISSEGRNPFSFAVGTGGIASTVPTGCP